VGWMIANDTIHIKELFDFVMISKATWLWIAVPPYSNYDKPADKVPFPRYRLRQVYFHLHNPNLTNLDKNTFGRLSPVHPNRI